MRLTAPRCAPWAPLPAAVVTLGLASFLVLAAVPSASQELVWESVYGSGIAQDPPAAPSLVVAAPDDGVFVAGTVGYGGTASVLVTRYDLEGTVWARTLDLGHVGMGVSAMAADPAGNVVVATVGWTGERALVSYDAGGSLRWMRPGLDIAPTAMAADASGRFTLLGDTGGIYPVSRLAAVDSQGALLWEEDLPGGGRLAVGPAGDVYVARTSPPGPGGDVILECRDAAGVLAWRRIYDNAGRSDTVAAIVPRPGGGVHLLATSFANQSDLWTLAIDASGQVVWSADYSTTAFSEDPLALASSAAGDVYVLARERSGVTRPLVLRYDASGQLVFMRAFDLGYPVLEPLAFGVDGSGSVYLTAFTFQVGIPTGGIPVTVRLDPSGSVTWARVFQDPAGVGAARGLVAPGAGGAYVLLHVDALGQGDMLTLRYSPTGGIEWASRERPEGLAESAVQAVADGLGRLVALGEAYTGAVWEQLVAVFDPDGGLRWTRRVAGCCARALSSDRFGDVFVQGDSDVHKLAPDGELLWSRAAGSVFQTLQADDRGGLFVAAVVGPPGGYRLRTTRYTPSGDVAWSHDDVADVQRTGAVALDGSGGVVASGGVPGIGGPWVQEDARVVRRGGDGTLRWAVTLPNANRDTDLVTGLAVDAEGSTFAAIASFAEDVADFILFDSSLGLAKVDRDGHLAWTRDTPTGLGGTTARVALDGRGRVFLAGSRKAGAVQEILLQCYDAAGTLVWERAYAGSGEGAALVGGLAVDGAGNVYVAGTARDGPTTDFLTLKYDGAGQLSWAHRVDGDGGYDAAAAAVLGANGAVYVAGTTWRESTGRDIIAARYGTPGAPTAFFTLVPCRVLDTREPPSGGPLPADAIRVVDVAGSGCAVPATARAIALNATVTGPTASGHIVLHPAGEPTPNASVLSYSAGQTRGASTVAGLAQGGRLVVRPFQAAGSTHVILDVTGYFE